MKVVVETVEPTQKRLHIEIPADTVRSELSEAFEELQKTAQVPGFRRNKVPRPVLRARFGKAVEEDVLRQIVPDTCIEAIEEHALEVVGDMTLEPPLDEMTLTAGEPLRFDLVVEVKPELSLPDLSLLQVDKSPIDVTQDEVDKYIERIRRARGTLEDIEEDRPAAEGDIVFVDWVVRVEGADEPVDDRKDYDFELGKGAVLPEVEQAVLGMSPGDAQTFTMTFSEDHPNAQLAGKQAEISVTLSRIARLVLPEVNDEFAKLLEYPDVQRMRAGLWNQLVEMRKAERRTEQEKDLLEQLRERVSFDMPEGALRERQRALVVQELERRQQFGDDVRDTDVAELMESLRDTAEESLRNEWILDAIAGAEEIEVDEDDVREYVHRRARLGGQDPEKFEARVRASDRWESYERYARDERVFDRLIELAAEKPIILTV